MLERFFEANYELNFFSGWQGGEIGVSYRLVTMNNNSIG
jgi:hypothetical protein